MASEASAPVPHTVIDEWRGDHARNLGFFRAFSGEVLALDVHGIDIGRHGKISLVVVGSPERVIIVDLLGKNSDCELVKWLQGVLEDESVSIVIHDCRMESDALYHLLKIKIPTPFDTACWNSVLTKSGVQSLGTVLDKNGIKSPPQTHIHFYDTNPTFWEQRPLTQEMIETACTDVNSLVKLRDLQLKQANTEEASRAMKASETFVSFARDASIARLKVPYWNIGRFMGKSGRNIRNLRKRSNTIINRCLATGAGAGSKEDANFIVYYDNQASLDMVMAAANPPERNSTKPRQPRGKAQKKERKQSPPPESMDTGACAARRASPPPKAQEA